MRLSVMELGRFNWHPKARTGIPLALDELYAQPSPEADKPPPNLPSLRKLGHQCRLASILTPNSHSQSSSHPRSAGFFRNLITPCNVRSASATTLRRVRQCGMNKFGCSQKGIPHMLNVARQSNGLLAIRTQPLTDRRSSRDVTHRDQNQRSVDHDSRPQSLSKSHSVSLWWRRMQIERRCRYTARLLKRLNCFHDFANAYLRMHPAPHSVDEMCAHFLASLKNHRHPVLRAVAALELACMWPVDPFAPFGARPRITTIYWDRNPNQVMDALDRDEHLPDREPRVRYVLRMGSDTPNGVSCVRQLLRA